MTTATIDEKETESATNAPPPIRYTVADEKIAELRAQYAPLKIEGVKDKSGYQAVRTARLHCRSLRAEVEKTRKALKEDALKYGREVDAEAKRITALLEEVEIPLLEREEAIDAEKAAEEAAAQKKIDDMVRAREESFLAVGVVLTFTERQNLPGMSEEEYQGRLFDATEAYNLRIQKEAEDAAELGRLKAEEDARQAAKAEEERLEREAEAARLAAQRAEQEAREKALAEREAALKAEADRIAAERDAAARAAEIEKARADAAEKAKREAAEKAKRNAREEADRIERERVIAEKAAALLPDKEKILAYLDSLRAVPIPEMNTAEGSAMLKTLLAGIKAAALAAVK